MAKWVDINSIDKTVPFCRAAYSINYSSSVVDNWMAEKPNVTYTVDDWLDGTSEAMGYYTLHRWNMTEVTCLFSSMKNDETSDWQGDANNVRYGLSIKDYNRSLLPLETINGANYRVIDYRDFQGYIPLYKCKAVVADGSVLVDIDLGEYEDKQAYSVASDTGIIKVPFIGSNKAVKVINKGKNIYRI